MNLDSRLQLLFDMYSDIRHATNDNKLILNLSDLFVSLNFSASFISGVPLPGKPINSLVVSNEWYLHNNIKLKAPDFDIVFSKVLDWNNSFVLKKKFHHQTAFCGHTEYNDKNERILVSPILSVPGYQGVVVHRFNTSNFHQLQNESQPISLQERIMFCTTINFAFSKLFELNKDKFFREGGLTKREKDVLSISALGNTSAQTAHLLNISERTVISHLQNASHKMNVSNRTECVIQAIRYQQIGPGAGYGFYQIEHEIYPEKNDNKTVL